MKFGSCDGGVDDESNGDDFVEISTTFTKLDNFFSITQSQLMEYTSCNILAFSQKNLIER